MTPFADFEAEIYQAGVAGATPSLPMTLEGFELAAAQSMTPQSYAYVAGSASPGQSSRWWPTSPGQGAGALRHSPGVVEGSAQQHLDLGIEAAKFIGRPPGQGIVDGWVEA